MTTLKLLFTVLVLFSIFVLPYQSRADNTAANKTAELNSQIIQEIKTVLEFPYLKYNTTNLTGNVNVTATVSKEGKIIFMKITGINENLQSNVFHKLNSLNLWASPDYSGKIFSYNIKYKN